VVTLQTSDANLFERQEVRAAGVDSDREEEVGAEGSRLREVEEGGRSCPWECRGLTMYSFIDVWFYNKVIRSSERGRERVEVERG